MNMAKLMKQAQQMQAGLAAEQEQLAMQTVTASAGGGKVEVTATQVKLTAPNGTDSITVQDTGLQLNFLGGQLHAGTLKINEAGMIMLG